MDVDSALEEEMNFLTQDDDDIVNNYYYSSSEELTHFSPPAMVFKREKSVDIFESQMEVDKNSSEGTHEIIEMFPPDVPPDVKVEMESDDFISTQQAIQVLEDVASLLKEEEEEDNTNEEKESRSLTPPLEEVSMKVSEKKATPIKELTPPREPSLPKEAEITSETTLKDVSTTPLKEPTPPPSKESTPPPEETSPMKIKDEIIEDEIPPTKISSRRQTVEEEELDGFADVIFNGSYVEIQLDDDEDDEEEEEKDIDDDEEKNLESEELDINDRTVINSDHNYVTKSEVRSSPSSANASVSTGDLNVRTFLIEYLEKRRNSEDNDDKRKNFVDEIISVLKTYQKKENENDFENSLKIHDSLDVIEIPENESFGPSEDIEIPETQVVEPSDVIDSLGKSTDDDSSKLIDDLVKVAEDSLNITDESLRVNDDLENVTDDLANVSDDLANVSDDLLKVTDDLVKVTEDLAKVTDDSAEVLENSKELADDSLELPEISLTDTENSPKETEDSPQVPEISTTDPENSPKVTEVPETNSEMDIDEILQPTNDHEKSIEDVLNQSIESIIKDHKDERSIQEELKKTTNIDISIDDLLNPIDDSSSTDDKKSEDKSDGSEETTETTDGSDDTTEDTTTSEDLPEDPTDQGRPLERALSMDIFDDIDELPEEFPSSQVQAAVESISKDQDKSCEEDLEKDDNLNLPEVPKETERIEVPQKTFETIETQTNEEFVPKIESIKKLYEFASKLMEDCRLEEQRIESSIEELEKEESEEKKSEDLVSTFQNNKLDEMKKFVQLFKPLPETAEISIQTEKFVSEKRLKKRNEKERMNLLASSDSSESESDHFSSDSEQSKKSFGNSELDLSQFLQSDLLVNDEGNVDLGSEDNITNQLEEKKEKTPKDKKEEMTEEELERLREEEEDREIERLVNFKGLKKRKIQIQYYSRKIEKQKPLDSPKSDKKSDEDNLQDICSEAQKLSDESNSEAEEEVITEQQFLEKINEKTKADLLNSTSEEDEEDYEDINDILNSEEEDENKSTPLVDTFLKTYDPFEEETVASGADSEKAIDAEEIKALLPAEEVSPPKEDDSSMKDDEEKKTDENESPPSECEILDEGLKRKQIRPKSLDKLLADADKRKKIAKIDEDLISLSSSSSNSEDSDVEEVASEDNSHKRVIKPMLRADQLAGETKQAQRQENDRIKRLEKKESNLQKIIKDAMAKGILSSERRELILDYNSEKKEFIKVHPDLVKLLKDHQFEGIKFMYDCCYGSVEGIKKHPGSGCILAHCMGLGKTLQLIALLHTVISYKELKTSRVLVLCPKSTVMNWADEIVRWLEPLNCKNLKVFTFPDTSDINEKLRILEEWSNSATNPYNKKVGCLLIGYEAFRTLVFYANYKKRGNINPNAIEVINTKVQKLLINPGADLVVCDEGHIIKNRKSATSSAVAEIKTAKRIILTGTPIQNNLKEYYAMVNFIKPLFLGTEREFANLYANPIKAGQHKDSSKREIKIMKQRSYVLHKKLSKFVQRKEAALLKTFLPQKYEYVLFVPMTETQNRLYEFILDVLKKVGGSKGKTLIIDYTCLRKIWTHPKVLETAYNNAIINKNKKERKNLQAALNPEVDDEQPDDVFDSHDGVMSVTNNWWRNHLTQDDLETLVPSNKLLTMFEILRMCEEMGEKCLIFSAFVAVLNVVEHFLRKVNEKDPRIIQHLPNNERVRNTWVNGKDFYRLDGKTPKSIRHELIKNFNNAQNDRARVFLISAKAGGQGINLIGANRVIILDTSWNPSNDQQNIFRIFRLGQKKNCYIYRLLAMGTMEEKVYSRSVTKQAMSFRVVDEQQIERHYSMSELAELYTLTKPNYSERPVPTVPQDAILAYLIRNQSNLVYKYHEHDSLLENKVEQELSEQDKEDAWAAYEHDMRSTNDNNAFAPGVQALYQNFMGQQSLATNYLQSLAGFPRNFNPALPGFGLESLGPGFNFQGNPYMDMLNMYPNYLSSAPPSNPLMFGNPTPTSVAAALNSGSNPNYNPSNFMSSPPPAVSPIPSMLNNPLSALSSLSFGHNQQRIGPSTSPFMNPRNTPPNGPPPLPVPGNSHDFDILRRKFENFMSNPSQQNPVPPMNRYNSPQPISLPSILNRNPPPPTNVPPIPTARSNPSIRVPPGVNSPLHINPNISRSMNLISSTSPKSFSPNSNSPSIPTSVIMKKKQDSTATPPPSKRGRSDSPQVTVVKTPPQPQTSHQSKQSSPPTAPPEAPKAIKETINKNNVAEISRPINIGIHYPEKNNPDPASMSSTLNMGIVYPSAVNTPVKPPQKQPPPQSPAQRILTSSRQSPIPLQRSPAPLQMAKTRQSPVPIQRAPGPLQITKSASSPQIQKNLPSTTQLQKNLMNTSAQKTFPTAMPKNSNIMPKLQPTTINKVMLPTPKAKAGSGMQIIPTTGVGLNTPPKTFDQISPSISLTALNPKATNTSQRNSSPSAGQRSGLQIKQVKGADGKTQIIATSTANTPTSTQKSFPVTLVKTAGSNSPQVVGTIGKGGVPPLAKVSNVSTVSKQLTPTSKPSMVSVNLNKLNEASNKNSNNPHTVAAKAMLSLSNPRQVIMKQGIKPTTQTVPPLTISKTATGATIKKITTIPDPSNLHQKVVSAGNQPLTKVVTTNPPNQNQSMKVINAPPIAKRIELNSKTLAAVKNSINSNNASKSGIIIVDGNKKFNITKPVISNQIGNTVQNLPSGATITRVIQRKRPAFAMGKVVQGQPQAVAKLVTPPQKRRKVEINAGAGTSGGHKILIKNPPPIVEID
ncbi:ATRX.2 family protein [Megaselia abdita]